MTKQPLQLYNSRNDRPLISLICRRRNGRRNNGGLPMNWDRIEGNWKQFTGKVQQQWAKLTDDDLKMVQGKREELIGRIQERYGYAKDQASREVDEWLRKNP
jgi:uncharacterized protein YjbJ (UPF0337 family)